jgi:hypothetical protein
MKKNRGQCEVIWHRRFRKKKGDKGISHLESIPTDSLPQRSYPDKSYFVHWWLLVEKHHSNTLAHPHLGHSPSWPVHKASIARHAISWSVLLSANEIIQSIIAWFLFSETFGSLIVRLSCEWDRTTLQLWRLLLILGQCHGYHVVLPPACCKQFSLSISRPLERRNKASNLPPW